MVGFDLAASNAGDSPPPAETPQPEIKPYFGRIIAQFRDNDLVDISELSRTLSHDSHEYNYKKLS